MKNKLEKGLRICLNKEVLRKFVQFFRNVKISWRMMNTMIMELCKLLDIKNLKIYMKH